MATGPIQPQNSKSSFWDGKIFQNVKESTFFSKIRPQTQLDNITEIESQRDNVFFNVDAASKQPPAVQKEQTNKLKEEFIKRATYYTIVNLLYNKCSSTPLKDDIKFFQIVNELLLLPKQPGHFKIIRTFLKHFKESNWITVTFYYFFYCGWLPRYYIKEVTNNVVQYVRESTKGQKISPIISKLFKILNDFLVEYNQIVRDFTKNPHPALRADYVQTALKDPKYLKNLSDSNIYQTFGKLFATKFIPDFDMFSKPIESARRLDFWKTENPILSIIKGVLSTVLYPLKFWEWLLGSLPTKFIKKYSAELINDQVPKMLENSFNAIGREQFVHAINSSIYAFLTNILNSQKNDEEELNYVDGPLKTALYGVGKNLLFTLDRVNFQSAYELSGFEKDGRKKAFWEKATERLNLVNADEQFTKSLQNVFVFTFNYLSNPKRAEPYLSLVFTLLNSTFEKPHNNLESDEEFFKKEYEKTERKLDEKIDQFIQFIIARSVSENIDEAFGKLSKDQKEQVKSIYRKLKSNLEKPFSKLQQEALQIREYTNKIASLTPSENEKLETYINSVFEKLIIIENDFLRLSKINSPLIKNNFELGTTSFIAQEHHVNKNLISLKNLVNRRNALSLIIEELKASNHTITNITAETDLISLLSIFQTSFDKISALNNAHQFDYILNIYGRLIKKVKETIKDKNYEKLNVLLIPNSLLSQYAAALIAFKKTKALEIKQAISELINLISPTNDDTKAIQESLNEMLSLKTPRQIDHALKTLTTYITSSIEAKKAALKENPLQVALQPIAKSIQQTILSIPNLQVTTSNEIKQTAITFCNEFNLLHDLLSNLETSAKIKETTFIENLISPTKTSTIVSSMTSALGGSVVWLTGTLTFPKMAIISAISYIFMHTTASPVLQNRIKNLANDIASPIISKYINATIKLLIDKELGFYQGLAKRAMVAFISENKMA
ncbi:MAG: hypothetical protein HZB76_05630 [Chlamydiae bacterium]|nr:hypothetical protein [Chlamydiota bacterium]